MNTRAKRVYVTNGPSARRHRRECVCGFCCKTATSATKRGATVAVEEHERQHTEKMLQSMLAEGLIEACGERDGETVWRLTEFGRASTAGMKAPMESTQK